MRENYIRSWWNRILCLLIFLAVSIPAGLKAQLPVPDSDSAFIAFRDEANILLEGSGYSEMLQQKYADAFYAFYSENPESHIAEEALKDAVIFWINLSQGEMVDQVLTEIPPDSGVWPELLSTLYFSSSVRLQTNSKFLPILESLNTAQTDPEALSVIKFALAGQYLRAERIREAMDLYREILDFGRDDFFSTNARNSIEVYEAIGPGNMVPELNMINSDGEPVRLSDFQGRFVILDFWTDEVPFSINSHRSLESLAERYPQDEVQILGVIQSRDEQRIARLMIEYDPGWPILRIPEESYAEAAENFRFNGFFRRLLIDRNGMILSNRIGTEELQNYLDSLAVTKN